MATLHLQFFSSLCTIINSIEGPRKHPTNWAPQLLRPALQLGHYKRMSIVELWGYPACDTRLVSPLNTEKVLSPSYRSTGELTIIRIAFTITRTHLVRNISSL